MDKDEQKQIMQEALTDFFKSEAGEELIGNIVLKAVDFAMQVEMDIEEFDKEKMTHITKRKRVNVQHFLVKYLPRIEGRLAGVQEDANKTLNIVYRAAKASLMHNAKKRNILPWRR